MKKVLIIGVNGFIGHHLATRILRTTDWHVYGMDMNTDRIAGLLEEIGVDYIEGGYPGANVVDDAFFAEPRTKRATFTAFGMAKRSGRSVGNDPGVQATLNSRATAAGTKAVRCTASTPTAKSCG